MVRTEIESIKSPAVRSAERPLTNAQTYCLCILYIKNIFNLNTCCYLMFKDLWSYSVHLQRKFYYNF